jgi:hypothetical protein
LLEPDIKQVLARVQREESSDFDIKQESKLLEPDIKQVLARVQREESSKFDNGFI